LGLVISGKEVRGRSGMEVVEVNKVKGDLWL
jgi:hypothetical protein